MKHSSLEKYLSFESNENADAGIEAGQRICAGGLGLMTCTKAFETDIQFTIGRTDENSFLVDYNEKTKTFQFTSTWSYTSSEDPEVSACPIDY